MALLPLPRHTLQVQAAYTLPLPPFTLQVQAAMRGPLLYPSRSHTSWWGRLVGVGGTYCGPPGWEHDEGGDVRAGGPPPHGYSLAGGGLLSSGHEADAEMLGVMRHQHYLRALSGAQLVR